MFSLAVLAPLALKIGGWLFGFAEKQSSDAVRRYEIESGVKIEEVKARATTAAEEHQTMRAFASEGTQRQALKMNFTVFWVIIVAALGPPVVMMWALAIYNVAFWENGIWPQSWSIAAFPPQAAVWVDKAIDWLFDPVGLGATIGTAGAAGWLTARRK